MTITLNAIKKVKVAGNHFSDMNLLMVLGQFIGDESNSITDRIEALKYSDNVVMGLGINDSYYTKEVLEDTVKVLRSYEADV